MLSDQRLPRWDFVYRIGPACGAGRPTTRESGRVVKSVPIGGAGTAACFADPPSSSPARRRYTCPASRPAAVGDAGPRPGDRAEHFFGARLALGTGGTCWAANGALHALLRKLHEAKRAWSPFNFSLSVRIVRGERMVGFWFGRYGERTADARRRFDELDEVKGRHVLEALVGLAPDHVSAIPPDRELPSPPVTSPANARSPPHLRAGSARSRPSEAWL